MRRWITITIAVMVWVAVATYIVLAVRLKNEERLSLHARSLSVIVADSAEMDIVLADDVLRWIDSARLNPIGAHIDSIGTDKLETMIAPHPFVRSVKAFGDIRGDVFVVVRQREPSFRIMNTERGDDFYYTTDGYIVPIQPHSAHYVPVITGDVPLPFKVGYMGRWNEADGNYEHYLQVFELLRSFVVYITSTPQWSNTFEQIVFEKGQQKGYGYCVRLVPRVGGHTILLGGLDDYESKLARLVVYYERVASNEGWNKYSEIDIRYNGQVIGR